MAPALGQAFHADSFKEITASLALVGGDQDRIVPPASNIRRYASFLPTAEVTMIEGAGHYSLLDDCIPKAADDVPLLCAELPGVNRDAIHARIVDLARNFFSAKL
jgi:predicted dienelactone hydrolase